jgi:hypothetical protein
MRRDFHVVWSDNDFMSAIFDEGEAARGEVQLTLDATLIYEDLSTGLRAKQVLELAARQLRMAPNFNLAIWRFDMLRESCLRKTALNEASVAVIGVVSAHGQQDLPKVAMAWLKQWLKRKGEESRALIVSLDHTARDSASAGQTISWLQKEALARDVAVFPHFGDTPRRESGLAMKGAKNSASAKAAVLADIRRWTGRHSDWGINE